MDKITARIGIFVIAIVLMFGMWTISSCQMTTDVVKFKYYEDKKERDAEWYDSRGYKKVTTGWGSKWVKDVSLFL